MTITAEYLHQPDYLLVKVSPLWTTKTAMHIIKESKAEAITRGYCRILFDLTQWKRPEIEMTRFYSGEYLAKEFASSFRVAAFALPEAINKFGENAAVNRGALYRIFPDERLAIEWLMKETNKASEATSPIVTAPQS